MPLLASSQRYVRQLVQRIRRFNSNASNYDNDYYGCAENHSQILKNIGMRQMTDQFKELFDPKTLNDSQLLSDAIMRNIESMPNKLDPIW